MTGPFDALDVLPYAVSAIVGILAWIVLSRVFRSRSSYSALPKSEIEQRFLTVFGLTPLDRREALINHYMVKHRCSRHEAMKIAMEARYADEERW